MAEDRDTITRDKAPPKAIMPVPTEPITPPVTEPEVPVEEELEPEEKLPVKPIAPLPPEPPVVPEPPVEPPPAEVPPPVVEPEKVTVEFPDKSTYEFTREEYQAVQTAGQIPRGSKIVIPTPPPAVIEPKAEPPAEVEVSPPPAPTTGSLSAESQAIWDKYLADVEAYNAAIAGATATLEGLSVGKDAQGRYILPAGVTAPEFDIPAVPTPPTELGIYDDLGNVVTVSMADALKMSELKGVKQFEWMIKLGLIEPDSSYLPATGGYVPGSVVRNMKINNPELYDLLIIKKDYRGYQKRAEELEAEYKAFEARVASGELVKMPDGQYVVSADLAELETASPEGYRILTTEGYEAFETWLTKGKKTREKTEKEFLSEGANKRRETMFNAGLSIMTTKYLKDQPVPTVTYRTYKELTPEEQDLVLTYYSENIPSPVGAVWRALTPWDEEKDETLLDYIRETPKRMISPDVPSQAELKATYEAEQTAPLWAQILFGTGKFGSGTVAYDEKSDTYFKIVHMVVPEKKTAAGIATAKIVKTIKASEIGLSKTQLARLVKFRIAQLAKAAKPGINWDKLLKAIQVGKVKTAAEATKWAARAQEAAKLRSLGRTYNAEYFARMAARGRGRGPLTAAEIKAMADAVKAASRATQLSALVSFPATLIPSSAPVSKWKPFKPSELTPARMKELMTEWTRMTPTRAIQQINSANLVTAVTAYYPEAFSKMLSKVTPAQRQKTISRLQPATQEAFKAGELAEAQSLAQTQLKVNNQIVTTAAQALATSTQAATKAMVDSLADTRAKVKAGTMTQAQALKKAQVAAQAAAQQAVANATKSATETAVKTAIQSATKTITDTATQVATETVTKPTEFGISRFELRLPIPKLHILPKWLLIPKKEERAKPKKRKKAAPPAIIAWRQGSLKFKGRLKPVWKVLRPPYDKLETEFKKPTGAYVVTGARSAYATAQRIGTGTIPRQIRHDMGIMDVTVERTGKRKLKVRFKGKGAKTQHSGTGTTTTGVMAIK